MLFNSERFSYSLIFFYSESHPKIREGFKMVIYTMPGLVLISSHMCNFILSMGPRC